MPVNVLDPELPFLASQAAIEIDQILHGAGSELAAVRQLADRLKSTLSEPGRLSSQRSLATADAATVTVLGQAWNESRDQQHLVTDISELSNKTAEIADQLASAAPSGQHSGLEWMRAYCLALSRCAAGYRKSIFDMQKPHPFRR